MTPSQSNITADFFMVHIIYSMASRKVNHNLQNTHFYAKYKIASRFDIIFNYVPMSRPSRTGSWGKGAGRKFVIF
jgi:hypothetical protein